MRATGIVRKVDELGRIVLPIELRRTIGIAIKDPLAVYIDGESIILKKYETGCVICGEVDETRYFRGKMICSRCVEELSATRMPTLQQ